MTLQERFWSKVHITESCWLWTGGVNKAGYGRICIGVGHTELAHRVACAWAGRPIPEGLVSDHLCRNRRCVNPDHIEAVTRGENVMRGIGPCAQHARRVFCRNCGTRLETRNGERRCWECRKKTHAAASERYNAKRRQERRQR